MHEILTKIKSRGYWKLIVHPVEYIDNRFERLGELINVVRDLKVSLRGWAFPLYDTQNRPSYGQDYVEQSVDWSGFVEIWRYHQSGQFLALKGVWEDWRGEESRGLFSNPTKLEPMQSIDLLNFIYTISEFFLFAQRLALNDKLTNSFQIAISLNNSENRKLISLDPRRLLFNNHVCQVKSLEFSKTFNTSQIASELESLIIESLVFFFDRFGWHDFNGQSFLPTVRDYINGKKAYY
jgi:hypothetical protein